MRGLPEELTRDGVSPLADVEKLVVEGRYGRADLALRRLEALIPSLAQTADDETLLLALYGRAVLLRRLGGGHQTAIAACDVLERAAHERQAGLWAAIACAARAQFRVDSGDIGGATADLARADSALAGDELTEENGYRLLNGLAVVYAGLRLQDRADETRTRIEHTISTRSPLDQAEHWGTWATELAARAMEPLAGGAQDPQQEFMSRAVELATKVDELPADAVPGTLRRGANGVRALAAAYRGRPSEALRLLGPDAFGTVGDLPSAERQIVSLAAMRAHALVGSLATARSLDDAAISPPATLPNLVLEVCRTRERLWLETYANGEVVPVLHRMTELLVRLGWRGMDLVADTARQALEHQALRTESRTDALTGVGNRRALDEELRQLLRFGPLPLALILVDVDHFKEINDRFTHVVGDEVLRRVAASLSLQLRTDDQLLRYGGDEFVVLLPGTGDEEANAVAERMCVAVGARPWNELADGLDVSITTGVAAVWSLSGRRPDADAEKLFRRADERLLAAKRERPGEEDARPLSAPVTSWDDDSGDDVAAVSMPPTPTRTLGAEVLGPHSRPGSRSVVSQGLNGGRRSTDPELDPSLEQGRETTGTPVNGVDLGLPPAGDPALADVRADPETPDGKADGHPYRGAAELPPTAARAGLTSGLLGGTRRSRRAARDAEAAASPVNGIPVEEQGARGAETAAAAVAARQATEARERAAREAQEQERAEREAEERQAKERQARERIEREARERAEREAREREARELAAREARQRIEAERREKEERERIEAESRRLAERIEAERREAQARAEAERLERERQAALAKAEAERRERERIEAERRERERIEAEARAEAEARVKAEAERERLERERIERERREAEARAKAAAEQRERERIAAEARARAEAERIERERIEAERRERARVEAERLERERLERERVEAERRERARVEAEARAKAEAERRERERIEAERLERERIERERREAEARAKAEADRLERERVERERAEAEAARRAAEKERLEKERKEALAKAEADRLERQRVERERRIHEARERAAAARRERETRERAEREEAERLAREQAAREEAERLRLEEVRRAAEEIRREAYERAARLAATASGNTGSWPTTQGPNTGSWMMPGAAAIESPTAPSVPAAPRPEQVEADRRFQEAAAEIYRPSPNLGPSTETFRALSDPLNDPVPGPSSSSSSSPAGPGSAGRPVEPPRDGYSGSYGSGSGSGSGYPATGGSEYSSGSSYGSSAYDDSYRSGSSYPSDPSAGRPPGSASSESPYASESPYSNGSSGYPSPYRNTPEEPVAPWNSGSPSPAPWDPEARDDRPRSSSSERPASRSANGWPEEDEEIDVREQPGQGQLPGTGRRDPQGPHTSRQAIIDLSARRRHRTD